MVLLHTEHVGLTAELQGGDPPDFSDDELGKMFILVFW
jgi:hypothetical protein